jgi:hypothetical protein
VSVDGQQWQWVTMYLQIPAVNQSRGQNQKIKENTHTPYTQIDCPTFAAVSSANACMPEQPSQLARPLCRSAVATVDSTRPHGWKSRRPPRCSAPGEPWPSASRHGPCRAMPCHASAHYRSAARSSQSVEAHARMCLGPFHQNAFTYQKWCSVLCPEAPTAIV